MDNKLRFNSHIKVIYKNDCQKDMHTSKKIYLAWNKSSKKAVIFSRFVSSHFSYCFLFCLVSSRKWNHLVNNVNKKSLGTITGGKDSNFKTLL